MKESSGWLLLHSLLVSRPIRCITKGKLRNQHRKTPRLSPPSRLLPPPPLSDLQMLDAAVKNNRAHFSFTYLPTNTSEELLSGASICARGGFFQLEKVAATPVSLLGSFPTQQAVRGVVLWSRFTYCLTIRSTTAVCSSPSVALDGKKMGMLGIMCVCTGRSLVAPPKYPLTTPFGGSPLGIWNVVKLWTCIIARGAEEYLHGRVLG